MRDSRTRATGLRLPLCTQIAGKAYDKDPLARYQDIFWALLNSNEFILNH